MEHLPFMTEMFLRVGRSSTNIVRYKMIETEDGSLSGVLARKSFFAVFTLFLLTKFNFRVGCSSLQLSR